jgi:hypothetical protein
MNLGEIAPLPAIRTKKASLLRSLLVGRKYISPSEMAKIRHVVTDTGYAKVQPYLSKGGIGRTVFRTLFGEGPNRMDILKARMRQGGLFGKGGVIHGDIAFDPKFFEDIKKFRQGERTLGKAWDIGTEGLSGGLNVAFTAGLPLMTAASYLRGESQGSDVAAEGLSTIGQSLGAPFGIVGAMAGGAAGTALGNMFKKEDPQGTQTGVPQQTRDALHVAKGVNKLVRKAPYQAFTGYTPDSVSFEAPEPEIYLPQQY